MSALYLPLEVSKYREHFEGAKERARQDRPTFRGYDEYDDPSGWEPPLWGTGRDAVLSALPYREYLRTSHWLRLRTHMLRRAGYRCMRIGCEAEGVQLDVHHLSYDNLGREPECDLIVLCHRCHQGEHLEAQP